MSDIDCNDHHIDMAMIASTDPLKKHMSDQTAKSQ